MKKIALIILYFGKIPDYAYLFFHSLSYNPTIDLLIFTDQKIKFQVDNLIVYTTTFAAIRKRIQEKFDFSIVLDKPYKLCDYKPAYGYIFEKELENYDFWGHCDLDMILGDLRKFLPEKILNSYDKIYQHGHLCLYRNIHDNNRRFMLPGGMNYKEVFTTPVNCIFDEVIGMQKKYDVLGIETYKKRDSADISPWDDMFIRVESYLSDSEKKNFNFTKQLFYWEEGHIYRAYVTGKQVCRDEFNYLHFQKRIMPICFKIENTVPNAFYITRDGVFEKEVGILPSVKTIDQYNKRRWWKYMEKKIQHQIYIWNRRMNKYIFKH
jgi:hypothetical protein